MTPSHLCSPPLTWTPWTSGSSASWLQWSSAQTSLGQMLCWWKTGWLCLTCNPSRNTRWNSFFKKQTNKQAIEKQHNQFRRAVAKMDWHEQESSRARGREVTLAVSLGWQQWELGRSLGWLGPVVAAVPCPLRAVGTALDEHGSGCCAECGTLNSSVDCIAGDPQRWTEQSPPLLFPLYSGEFVHSGLYTISSELVGHFTASLENEQGWIK